MNSDDDVTLLFFSNTHTVHGNEHCHVCARARESRHAEEAINRFVNTTGVDRADAVADLLESLMFWCMNNQFDFDAELTRAKSNAESLLNDSPAMEIQYCTECNDPLEEGRIGCCDVCTDPEDETLPGDDERRAVEY